MPMDDRLARLLLENNLMQRQQSDERRLALLEKLATKGLSFGQIPIPGVTPGATFKKIFIEDDFISGVVVIGSGIYPGVLAWNVVNATVTMLDTAVFDLSHPGIASIESPAGSLNFLALPPLPSVNSFDNLQFVMRFNNLAVTGDTFRIGIISVLTTYDEGVFFQYSYGDTNWQTITADGPFGGTTQNDSGVAFDPTKWFLFGIKRKTTDVFEFYINQILVATHSTNISTEITQFPIMFANNAGAGTFKFYVDYFSIEMATTIQRWG